MLLGSSSECAGLDVDIELVVTPGAVGDVGVPLSAELLAFATAANNRSGDLAETREVLRDAVGDEGLMEAAATVAIFNGLVRVADGTGIQLDPSMMTSTVDDRARLGIDKYGGAANSAGAPTKRRSERRPGAADLFA